MQFRETKQRQLVLEAVSARCDHPTADDIYMQVRAIDDKISRGTVYRNLNRLSDTGKITHVRLPDCDRFDCRTDMHYHLVCTVCGSVFDAPIEYNIQFDEAAAESSGFKITRHRIFFEGICPFCRED